MQQQSQQTQRFPFLTEINVQTNSLPFDRIKYSETFQIQDDLCIFSNITLFVPREKEYCHLKGGTAREFDKVTLYLRAQFVGSEKTSSEKSNVGHSLYCHTGIMGNRIYF